MLHHVIDITKATPVEVIEAKIVTGFADCKSVSEIAAEIADALKLQDEDAA